METTKVFISGNSQAVRIPQHFRIAGDTVYIHKVGSALVLLPAHDPWGPLFLARTLVDDDFPERPEQQPWQDRA